MITTREVESVAAETGFRPDMVERVLRLHGILRRLQGHPMTRQAWLLKGGSPYGFSPPPESVSRGDSEPRSARMPRIFKCSVGTSCWIASQMISGSTAK